MADETGKIKVLYWNAISIQRDTFESDDYIINTGVDVVLLCETFLKSDIVLNSLAVYIWYRMNRLDGDKGGVAILVNNKIKHELLPSSDNSLLEFPNNLLFSLLTGIGVLSRHIEFLRF
jgi:hypothetical protein